MILNRYLSCQEDRAKDLGFFCCLVSHLTQHPEIDFENFSAFQPSSLEPHATFHCAQLQFPQGFSFASIGSLHSRPGQSTYPMMDSLSNWLLPRIPNHKHHRCSVSHEEYTPAQEDLSQDINSIDNGSFLRESGQPVCTGSKALLWPCRGRSLAQSHKEGQTRLVDN